jgi:hypothetical protein
MSQLQEDTRRRLRTPSYDAGFETSQTRPVYIVQVFTYQALSNFRSFHNGSIRSVRAHRTPADIELRQIAARGLRRYRREGLTRQDVQRLALDIIYAPESFGGVIRTKVRADLIAELANRFGVRRGEYA